MSSCFVCAILHPRRRDAAKSVLALKGRKSLESYRSISITQTWPPEVRECASYSMMLVSASELPRPRILKLGGSVVTTAFRSGGSEGVGF